MAKNEQVMQVIKETSDSCLKCIYPKHLIDTDTYICSLTGSAISDDDFAEDCKLLDCPLDK